MEWLKIIFWVVRILQGSIRLGKQIPWKHLWQWLQRTWRWLQRPFHREPSLPKSESNQKLS